MRKSFLSSLFLVIISAISHSQPGVGIGTNSPHSSALLELNSTGKGLLLPRMTSAQRLAISTPATGLMIYETTSGSNWYYNGSAWVQLASGGVSPWVVAGNNIYNSNSGNVGIGVSTPHASALLELKSNAKGLLLPRMLNLELLNISNPAKGLLLYDSSSNRMRYYDGTAWKTVLDNSYWSRNLVFNTVFNVNDDIGIGTNSPNDKLHVSGGNTRITNGNLIVDNAGGSTVQLRLGGADKGFLDLEGSDVRIGTSPGNTNDFIIRMNGINRMFMTSAGDMGLGVFPSQKLTVGGNANVKGDLFLNATGPQVQLQNSGVDIGFMQTSGSNFRVGTNSSNTTGNFVVRVNGGDRAIVNPEGTLHLTGGVDASLTGNGYLMIGNPASSNIVVDNNEIVARSNGTASSLILQNDGGSVRIGNVAVPAGYKFAINGKMVCEELKVKLASSGWPDYVFDKNYRLKSIKEVERFIEQNSHLPGIPSAAEVERNGLEVGDMQKRMMEKIEELTLYVIELQKQIDDLKNNKP